MGTRLDPDQRLSLRETEQRQDAANRERPMLEEHGPPSVE
jgi:hypothetical protein